MRTIWQKAKPDIRRDMGQSVDTALLSHGLIIKSFLIPLRLHQGFSDHLLKYQSLLGTGFGEAGGGDSKTKNKPFYVKLLTVRWTDVCL